MKRIAELMLVLLILASAGPTQAQIYRGPNSAKHAQKAARKYQKRAAKRQHKANKEAIKAQRRAMKRVKRHL